MTLSYTMGLTVGSLLAYMMETCFGLPVQAKDVCHKVIEHTTTPLNNITTSTLINTVSSTLPTIENVTPKVKTTVSVLTTLLTSTLMSNTTISTLTTGIMEASTTVSPKGLINVTTIVNNAILQH